MIIDNIIQKLTEINGNINTMQCTNDNTHNAKHLGS